MRRSWILAVVLVLGVLLSGITGYLIWHTAVSYTHLHPRNAHGMFQDKKGKPVYIFIIILVVKPAGIAVEDQRAAQVEK